MSPGKLAHIADPASFFSQVRTEDWGGVGCTVLGSG